MSGNAEEGHQMASGKSDGDASGPSLTRVFGSVLASLFGVQSGRNRERDFAQGRPWVYVAVGLVVTAAFVLTVWFAVKLVLKSAGA